MSALIVRGKRVIRPGTSGPASIHIRDGVIAAIDTFDSVPSGAEIGEIIDAGDCVVIPGLVDTHVHLNDPGRADWEGFAFGTRAAAAGGVTTVIDMPLNSIPPTTTVAGFRAKLEAAHGQCYVDVGFWGGVVPGNSGELAGLLAHGVVGFKGFLIHSGVEEFPNVTEDDLREALPELTRLGALLIVHAEVPGPMSRTGIPACPSGTPTVREGLDESKNQSPSLTVGVLAGTDRNVCPTRYATFLASRPRAAE